MTAPNIDEYMARARELADEVGRTPGLASLKKEFGIGEPKAKLIRNRLNEEGGSPKPTLPEAPVSPGMGPVRDLPSPTLPAAEEVEEDVPEDPPWPTSLEEDLPGEDPSPEEGVGDAPAAPSPAPVALPVDAPKEHKEIVLWPLLVIVLPAFVAIWGGWVDLGQMAGFGNVNLLPGLTDKAVINLSITLPVGLEAYASYAIYVWLSLDKAKDEALRKFAKWSALAALVVGGLGQGVYHLLKAFDQTKAPWPVVIFVALIPVVVSGLGAYLAHGVRHGRGDR